MDFVLNLPTIQAPQRTQQGKTLIYDVVRKKYVALTPEEWVRQHWLHFLIGHLQYPAGMIAVERGVKFLSIQRRADVVVYNKHFKPLLIIECKAPQVGINQQTFDQIARYNMTLQVPYLVVSNGIDHFCCKIDHHQKSYRFISEIPAYPELAFG
ncbi:MAG TPA: type I restriction enzyme HsdR N-terminal domain-containing protein [Chitinophagales bacterium]|nr:type I restriction enzyme HsdR N-terminal domain-containing protein [Chitinophagales bacterium]HRK27332.1 type I restriction enzyme HsdR N-terminal domain-containing protein [Chitinophagales bacterium]